MEPFDETLRKLAHEEHTVTPSGYDEMLNRLYTRLAEEAPGAEAPAPKRRHMHRFGAGAVAVAVAAALSVSALAYFGAFDWFRGYFEQRNGGGLGEGQLAFLQQAAVDQGGQTCTSNGVTMHLDSAVSDSSTVYLQLRMEGLEAKEEDYYMYNFETIDLSPVEGESSVSSMMSIIPDDGREGTAILIKLGYSFEKGHEEELSSGRAQTLVLENLNLNAMDGPGMRIATGRWEFPLRLSPCPAPTEWLAEPLACEGTTLREGQAAPAPYRALSLLVSATGAQLRYQWEDPTIVDSLNAPEIVATLRDGTEAVFYPSSGMNADVWSYTLSVPVPPEEIETLEFAGHVLPPPARP